MKVNNIKTVPNLYSAYKYDGKYHYKHKRSGTLWNCSKVENDTYYMYTVNAWGKIYEMTVSITEFNKEFKVIKC